LQFVLSQLLFSSFGWSPSLPTGSVLLSLTTRPCFEAEISALAQGSGPRRFFLCCLVLSQPPIWRHVFPSTAANSKFRFFISAPFAFSRRAHRPGLLGLKLIFISCSLKFAHFLRSRPGAKGFSLFYVKCILCSFIFRAASSCVDFFSFTPGFRYWKFPQPNSGQSGFGFSYHREQHSWRHSSRPRLRKERTAPRCVGLSPLLTSDWRPVLAMGRNWPAPIR
jgi:hypothetical protein